MKSEQPCLWISRLSFLVSAAALASFGWRTITDDALPSGAGEETTMSGARQLAVAVPAGEAPDPVTVTGARQTVSESRVAEATTEPAAPAGVLLQPTTFEASTADGSVQVKRLVVTEAVEDREPVEVSEVVSGETPVFAFLELATGQGAEHELSVSFEHEAGNRTGVVNLSVPANQSRWRTWGRTHDIDREGRWTAVVRDRRGAELGRTEFTVRSAS